MTPEGWLRRKAKDFAARSKVINTTGEHLPPLSITKGRGVILQSDKYKKQIATDLRKYVIARRDQFAFDPMSLYYGAIGRVTSPEIGLVSPDYVVFDVDRSVDKPFMNFLLRSPEQVALYEAVAETGNQFGKRRRVYWSVFEDLEVALPPLREQRKIAAILSSVDDAIEATQAVIDQLQVVKKAMMAELLTRGMPGRHKRFKKTENGEAPETWEIVKLGSIGNWLSGGTPSKQNETLWAGPIPWVSPKDMKRPRIDDAIDHIALAAIGHGAHLAPVDSILMVVRGMILAHSFPVALVTGPVAFNQDIKVLVLSAGFCPEYVLYWLQDSAERILQIADIANHGTKRIPTERFHALEIPKPSRDEQEQLVAIFRGLDLRRETESDTLAQLRAVKSALMSVLLSGELRVIPDPEPV